ncbi:metalloendoproteinase 1-MMP-like [Papaver somniferum]|uniref:metalloendoproteinase 1-MMP-like n=1 Tax=Papaver somniferum TaxID=3469 RepID=UPI000E7059F4|nr:metalloendoproteinase 1-MMP-like [Papaver somniferum]XP_026431587.1 metalloendoproteinase 1-MMP-like [Papaver somniferum]
MQTTKAVQYFQLVPFFLLTLFAILPNPTLSAEPFDFLQDLKGAHIGQTAPDATGSLDAETVKQMMMPRCGRADVVDAEPGKRKNNKDVLAASTPEKWSSSLLTYRFSSNSSKTFDKLDTETLKNVVAQAFAKWEAVSNFKFTEETNDDVGADMVIGFQKGDLGDGYRFDGEMGVVAHAFPPNDGRIYFDAGDKWSTHPESDTMDFESVAAHEIGHLLGLEHIFEKNTIMYPVFEPGSTKRQVQVNDVKALRAIYGS